MNVGKLLDDPIKAAFGALIVITGLYFVLRKAAGDTVKAVGDGIGALTSGTLDAVSGDNNLTKNAKDAAGNPVTAYQGVGFGLGTIGALFNRASGGTLASWGESVSSWFTPTAAPGDSNIFYRVLFPDGTHHAVGNGTIDKKGYFTFNGKTYRMGYNQANVRIAVPQ